MKSNFLYFSFGLGLAISNSSSAQIVHETVENYFQQLYATVPMSHTRFPEFDKICRDKYWFLINTHFFAEYKIDTDSKLMSSVLTYGGGQIHLNSATNWNGSQYEFISSEFPLILNYLPLKMVIFSVSKSFYDISAHLIFKNNDAQINTYQCVLATF